jgi:hypothetical protein
MVLDSLLAGVMLFSSFAARTPNVQPNPDDYEVSIGINHITFISIVNGKENLVQSIMMS